MRVAELQLQNFKGIDVRLPWSHINVLFGPNDSGKTNILEAVSIAFGASDAVRHGDAIRPPKFSALLEFTEDGDDELLAALFQREDVPPLFPAAPLTSSQTADDPATSAFRQARLRWGTGQGRPFVIRAPRSVEDTDESPEERLRLLSLPETIEVLHERALKAMRRRLADAPEAWADVDLLLRTALATKRARFERGVVSLLAPTLDEVDRPVVDAAARLATSGWRTDRVIGAFVAQLADRTPTPVILLRAMDRRELRPFDVVWSASSERDAEIDSLLRREFNLMHDATRGLVEAGRELMLALKAIGGDDEQFQLALAAWKK